jgi:hypothetical protein
MLKIASCNQQPVLPDGYLSSQKLQTWLLSKTVGY